MIPLWTALAGCRPVFVQIVEPAEGDRFRAGDPVRVSGWAVPVGATVRIEVNGLPVEMVGDADDPTGFTTEVTAVEGFGWARATVDGDRGEDSDLVTFEVEPAAPTAE